jgi:hypothetical protein
LPWLLERMTAPRWAARPELSEVARQPPTMASFTGSFVVRSGRSSSGQPLAAAIQDEGDDHRNYPMSATSNVVDGTRRHRGVGRCPRVGQLSHAWSFSLCCGAGGAQAANWSCRSIWMCSSATALSVRDSPLVVVMTTATVRP